jgi:polyisoprenoid-binding protein YceI
MKRLLLVAGVASVVGMAAWTGFGVLALARLARDGEAVSSREAAVERDALALATLADEVETLHADVRALAQGFGTSLQALHDELAARADENAAGIRGDLAAVRDEVGAWTSPSSPVDSHEVSRLLRELGRRLDAADASGPAGSAVPAADLGLAPSAAEPGEVAAAEREGGLAPAEAPPPEPPSAAPRRASFLAFQLPADDFRFDERRTWSVLPALSRVGFDAKTTLHDFSGVTSAVAGELECALGAPGEHPRGRIVVEAAQLGSGDAERDEAMREHLGVGAHATLEFVLTGFEPHAVDAGELRVAGTATGTMTIRGVTQAVSMPVELAVDDARRLSVEGEMTLDLETFGVPVPSKLGLITMEKDVKVWLALKLRANSRSEG